MAVRTGALSRVQSLTDAMLAIRPGEEFSNGLFLAQATRVRLVRSCDTALSDTSDGLPPSVTIRCW
jgi:hypothetical protein